MVTDNYRKLADSIKRHGATGTLARTCRMAGRRFIENRKLLLLKRDNAAPFTTIRKTFDTISGRELGSDDMRNVSFVASSRTKNFERYFSMGSRCYGFVKDGAVIGYSFTSLTAIPDRELGLTIPLAESQVYLFDFEVDRRSRGRGIAVELMADTVTYWRDRGIRESVCYVDSENVNSRRWLKRMDFKVFDVLECRRVLCYRNARRRSWDPENDLF